MRVLEGGNGSSALEDRPQGSRDGETGAAQGKRGPAGGILAGHGKPRSGGANRLTWLPPPVSVSPNGAVRRLPGGTETRDAPPEIRPNPAKARSTQARAEPPWLKTSRETNSRDAETEAHGSADQGRKTLHLPLLVSAFCRGNGLPLASRVVTFRTLTTGQRHPQIQNSVWRGRWKIGLSEPRPNFPPKNRVGLPQDAWSRHNPCCSTCRVAPFSVDITSRAEKAGTSRGRGSASAEIFPADLSTNPLSELDMTLHLSRCPDSLRDGNANNAAGRREALVLALSVTRALQIYAQSKTQHVGAFHGGGFADLQAAHTV